MDYNKKIFFEHVLKWGDFEMFRNVHVAHSANDKSQHKKHQRIQFLDNW